MAQNDVPPSKPASTSSPRTTPLRQDYRRTLGRVAHDIRSATGVAWTALAEIERASVHDDGTPTGLESFLKIGQRSLRRLLLLADRLTLAGAIEDGSLELSRCDTGVNELLKSVVDDVSFALGRRSIGVSLEPIGENLTISADGRWLAAAFAELIGNAIRFARTQVRIHVKEDSSLLTVCIEDDGPGLPEAAQASLTDGCPTPEGAHGLGLSLPLAHRVISAHGGHITVEPREKGEGSGTTPGTLLCVRIPRSQRSSSQ